MSLVHRSVVGLSAQEAQRRLNQDGPNELPHAVRRPLYKIVWNVLREPVFQLLLAAGLIYFLLGEFSDALILLVFVVLSGTISVVQEKRSERVLETLRDLSSPMALVNRSGQQQRIPSRDVVRGDLLLLVEGDRIPADGILVSAVELQVDESLITGESIPVAKWIQTSAQRPRVYSGSMVVKGHGLARVSATGRRTEIGKIGLAVTAVPEKPTRLAKDSVQLMKAFTLLAIAVSVMVVLGHGLSGRGWIEATLAGITVAMGLIPEEFAVIFAVFLAMGAWRMSQHHVLTRDRSAIETLGSATVLCTDKTGTLTLNQMQVLAVVAEDGQVWEAREAISPAAKRVIEAAAMSSELHPSDPMEVAIHRARTPDVQGLGDSDLPSEIVHEFRISSEFPAMTNIWKVSGKPALHAVMKGAPELVIRLCEMAPEADHTMRRAADTLAAKGLRVLGVARATLPEGVLPNSQSDLQMEFVGLVGLADPVRESVPQAVDHCKSAGIRVVMITGDYPVTAIEIARQSGIVHDDQDAKSLVMSGDQLDALTDAQLQARVESIRVFARIRPIQKLRIVTALQANGHVVAMTGDGVNDAPALKAADIGIAMGVRGTDVAREASSLVLLKEDFGAIVKAIERGRQIYDNLRKAIGFIVSIHVPIAGLAVVPVLFGQPMLFAPMHIGFLEMIIDPASSLIFESESAEPDLMERPPRDPQEPLYPTRLMISSLVQGAGAFFILLVAYFALDHLGLPQAEKRGLLFSGLVASGIAIIMVNMRELVSLWALFVQVNRSFFILAGSTLAMLILVFWIPWLRDIFKFSPISISWFLAPLAMGALCYLVLRQVRVVMARRFH